jgi:hypothetical protein
MNVIETNREYGLRRPKIYLETTIFNFYVDTELGDPHTDTVKLFGEIAAGKYEAFTSDYTVDELSKAKEDKRSKMMALLVEYKIPVLNMSDDAEKLAGIYVAENVIPEKYRTDGLHIAIATINDMDMIISMNFQHIVKRKTIKMTGHINMMNGYRAVEIYTPMEVIDDDND